VPGLFFSLFIGKEWDGAQTKQSQTPIIAYKWEQAVTVVHREAWIAWQIITDTTT
jgi:hypothetical protein